MKKDLGLKEKYSLLLFILVFVYVFVIGLIGSAEFKGYSYKIVFTLIYIIAAKVITRGIGKRYFTFAGLAIAVLWMAAFMHFEIVS